MNIIDIEGYKAIVQYDADLDMLRGEFIGLNGGADFYATTIDDLRKEGAQSLKVFLSMCKERGIEPLKPYSGRFNVRIPPKLHAAAVAQATAEGKSLNQFITDALEHQLGG